MRMVAYGHFQTRGLPAARLSLDFSETNYGYVEQEIAQVRVQSDSRIVVGTFTTRGGDTSPSAAVTARCLASGTPFSPVAGKRFTVSPPSFAAASADRASRPAVAAWQSLSRRKGISRQLEIEPHQSRRRNIGDLRGS